MHKTISSYLFYHQRNTSLREFPNGLSNSFYNTQPVLFKPQVTKVISFFLQTWQVRFPMGIVQQGESRKTIFIFCSLFFSPRRAFFQSSENMAKRHFWQIDIFFLKDFLARIIIWLDAPYTFLEIYTLIIFLSPTHELQRAFS